MKFLLLGISIFIALTGIQSQSTDVLYDYYFDEGVKYLNAEKYPEANKLFRAAEISTRDLLKQRRALLHVLRSDSLYVSALQQARKDAVAAKDRAVASADSARAARKDAQKRKRLSDALYLAFIADQEIASDGDPGWDEIDSIAMQLAFEATQLIADDTTFHESIHGVFGRAVYRATRRRVLAHERAVTNILLNSDGSFCSLGRDSTVTARDFDYSRKVRLEPGEFVQDVQLYQNGSIILTITRESNTVNIWERDSPNKPKYEIKAANRVNEALYVPMKNLLCIAMQQSTLQFWNLTTGEYTFAEHPGAWVRDIDFSSDSSMILSRGSDGSIGVWDVHGNVITPVFRAHEQYVFGAHFSPDDQHILTYSADQTAKIWSIDGKLEMSLVSHRNPVLKAEYSPGGEYIMTYSGGSDVCIWDDKGNRLVEILPVLFAMDERDVLEIHTPMFHPDGTSVLSVSGRYVQHISMQGLVTRVFDHGMTISSVDVSPDGKLMLTAGENGMISLWDLDPQNYDEGQYIGHRIMQIAPEDVAEITVAKFGPARNSIYFGMSNGQVQVVPIPAVVQEILEDKPFRIPQEFLIENHIQISSRF